MKLRGKYRCHVFDIPYSTGEAWWTFCGHSVKVYTFCLMMQNDIEIIYYGHGKSEVPCHEHVVVMDDEILNITYGDIEKPFYWEDGHQDDFAHRIFSSNSVDALRRTYNDGDFMFFVWGKGHKYIKNNFKHNLNFSFEHIGHFSHPICERRIYNSKYIRGYHEGFVHANRSQYLDFVIPNTIVSDSLEYSDSKEDYMLFVGRVIPLKGVEIAVQLSLDTGVPLIIAGPGDLDWCLSHSLYDVSIKSTEELKKRGVHFVGQIDVEERKKLMRDAKFLICPTIYPEPGGKVILESLYCGSPVICADTGGSPEYNKHGVTGFCCERYSEYIDAINKIDTISATDCNSWIRDNHSFEAIKPKYLEYFETLHKYNKEQSFWKL